LVLSVPNFSADALLPWVDSEGLSAEAAYARAAAVAKQREDGLKLWNLHQSDLETYHSRVHHRVLTPGSTLGEPLHLLSSLERPNPQWDTNPQGGRGGAPRRCLTAFASMGSRSGSAQES
jgi:hypothetical protein